LEISVIVPVYIGESKHVAMSVKCIELARQKTKLPYELIIVETCSDYLKDYADIHIYEKTRTDSIKSVNRAMRSSASDCLVVLTNDVFVDDGWLECLKDCFKIPDCGLATLGSTESKSIKEDKIIEGIWFPLSMTPQWLINKIGYYDEDYIRYWADTDYILKTYEAGYKMYRNLNCIVTHSPGTTLYNEPDHQESLVYSRTLFYQKHKDCKLPIFKKLICG
jgi:glycosyltransferase involved in cell wall biosynthesis